MSANKAFAARCLALALEDPARALVRLWVHLQDQRNLESDLDRARCLADARLALSCLSAGRGPFPLVHGVAALRAVGDHLAEFVDKGFDPIVREVELSPGEGGGVWLVLARKPGWRSLFGEEQAGQLELWLARYQVIPARHRGIEVQVKPLDRRAWQHLNTDRTHVLGGGFKDGVLPDWSETRPYRCRALKDQEARWASLEALLERAAEERAAIVLLPELTVDSEVLTRAREWLKRERRHRFAFVVAGSFHLEASSANGHRVPLGNVATVLDGWGEVLTRHLKLRPMRAMARGAPADEGIEAGSRACLLRAPFGLIGLAICLDFCEIGGSPVVDLWREIGPALVLVPSMGEGSTNRAHGRKARDLALQHGTATVVASQHPEDSEARGLCWQPKRGKSGRLAVEAEEGAPLLLTTLVWTRD